MSRNALVSAQRLAIINSRQDPPGWGPGYMPSMRATRDEAPTRSRPSMVRATALGRAIHCMSRAEFHATILALYQPRLFDLHEQHALSTVPTEHPLAGHPEGNGLSLPCIDGTVLIAERLGLLMRHPVVLMTVPSTDGGSTFERVPFPYIGDLLLFLRDQEGPYCVNWTVKKTSEDFKRTSFQTCRKPDRAEVHAARAEDRHRLEEMYFACAGIKTVRVSEDLLNETVKFNLAMLIRADHLPVDLSSEVRAELVDRFKLCVLSREAILHHIPKMVSAFSCSQEEVLTVLYQAIWRRELRVDLYRPIMVDKPIHPERMDVLDMYASWFER